MNYRNALKVFLFTTAFIALSLSGYQCATQKIGSDGTLERGIEPIDIPQDQPYPLYNDPVGDSLPQEPKNYTDENCRHRSQLRNTYSAPSAKLNLDSSALVDFRLGRRGNFETDCARVFVKMNGSKYNNTTVYQGSMNIAYVGTCTNGQTGICKSGMRTGYSISDARYNRWTAKVSPRNLDNVKFQAIFEDEHGAYILKIEDVRLRDLSDGIVKYIGAGEIYYKMFRIATSQDIHPTDQRGDCYNSGTYISQAHRVPPRAGKRCWLTGLGPYSCRPNGDILRTDPEESPINLQGNYKCFNYLGDFYGLDIEEAFNIVI